MVKSIKHAFTSNGEPTIQRVLTKVGIPGYATLEESLELYVTTRRWPEWALELCKSQAAKPVIDAMFKATVPLKLASLHSKVKGAKPEEVQEAVSELIRYMVIFEGVDVESFEIFVGSCPRFSKTSPTPPCLGRDPPWSFASIPRKLARWEV